jgi:endonuclease YncB( thermonuclease family)
MKRTSAPFYGCPLPYPTRTWRAKIIDVTDADTAVVWVDRGDFDTSTWELRLLGIDAVELNSGPADQRAKASEARRWLLQMADERWCYLTTEMDREKYGRLLGAIRWLGADGTWYEWAVEVTMRGWLKPEAA